MRFLLSNRTFEKDSARGTVSQRSFPEAHPLERRAAGPVGFGVEIGEVPVWSGFLGACSSGYCRNALPLERCIEPTTSSEPGSRASLSGLIRDKRGLIEWPTEMCDEEPLLYRP